MKRQKEPVIKIADLDQLDDAIALACAVEVGLDGIEVLNDGHLAGLREVAAMMVDKLRDFRDRLRA